MILNAPFLQRESKGKPTALSLTSTLTDTYSAAISPPQSVPQCSCDLDVRPKCRAIKSSFWQVVSGAKFCEIVDGGRCVSDGEGQYGNGETCRVKALQALVLTTEQYAVGSGNDYLSVSGTALKNDSGPQRMKLDAGAEVVWKSDGSGVSDGFKVCVSEDAETTGGWVGGWVGVVGPTFHSSRTNNFRMSPRTYTVGVDDNSEMLVDGGVVGGVVGTVLGIGVCIWLVMLFVSRKPNNVSKKVTHVSAVDSLTLAQVMGADFQSLCDAIREDNVLGPTGFCALVSRCLCTLTRLKPHPHPRSQNRFARARF